MKKKPVRKRLYRKPRLKRAKADWYVEPRFATELLIAAEGFRGRTWDPACGIGHCSDALRADVAPIGGREVISTDKVDRGYKHLTAVVDFLQPNLIASAQRIQNIVCNPPFKRAEILDWIRAAREIAEQKVALFLPIDFLASESRYLFFKSWPFNRVWVMSSRPSCPPGEPFAAGKVKAKGGTADYAWFVWERGQKPKREVRWLILPEALERERERAARRADEKIREAA